MLLISIDSKDLAMKSELKELQQLIARFTDDGELPTTAIPGLSLYTMNEPTDLICGMYEPSICVVAQGSKRVIIGNDSLVYDPNHYLISSIHLPTAFQILDASKEKPYLGLKLVLDLREISQLMIDSNLPAPREQKSSLGMSIGTLTPQLLNAFNRLIDLLNHETDIPILAPTIQREITYRLLTGDQGARLRQIASTGSQSRQIARVIEWLKENFVQPLKVEDLANQAGMSTSTFHHHFRSITALSPLQYQKTLRLQEARQLMLANHLDAAAAAYQVGYESPSQFSREYSRQFGAPPLKDINQLRQQMML